MKTTDYLQFILDNPKAISTAVLVVTIDSDKCNVEISFTDRKEVFSQDFKNEEEMDGGIIMTGRLNTFGKV